MTAISELSPARPVAGREHPVPPPTGRPAEVEAQFAQFSELCAAFSRMMLSRQGLRDDVGRQEDVARNLFVARTIFGKWGMEIMIVLYGKPDGLGFEVLRHSLQGISPRVLSQKLKSMENQGLVTRNVVGVQPFRVSYNLTHRGGVMARMAEPLFLFLDTPATHPVAKTASGSDE